MTENMSNDPEDPSVRKVQYGYCISKFFLLDLYFWQIIGGLSHSALSSGDFLNIIR